AIAGPLRRSLPFLDHDAALVGHVSPVLEAKLTAGERVRIVRGEGIGIPLAEVLAEIVQPPANGLADLEDDGLTAHQHVVGQPDGGDENAADEEHPEDCASPHRILPSFSVYILRPPSTVMTWPVM